MSAAKLVSALALSVVADATGSVTNPDTRYMVHYLPWMTGPGSAHWCNGQYGNSYYSSLVGQWTCEDTRVLRWQATLMLTVGISGVWFDYQLQEWNSCIEKMVPILAELNMTYAIMLDTYNVNNIYGALPWVQVFTVPCVRC